MAPSASCRCSRLMAASLEQPLVAADVELTTESVGVPGDKGQPLGPAAKKKKCFYTSSTSERCHCSALAHTVWTEPGAAVPGRNEVLPGKDTTPELAGHG